MMVSERRAAVSAYAAKLKAITQRVPSIREGTGTLSRSIRVCIGRPPGLREMCRIAAAPLFPRGIPGGEPRKPASAPPQCLHMCL